MLIRTFDFPQIGFHIFWCLEPPGGWGVGGGDGGGCVVEDSEYTVGCFGGDVYWFDDCGDVASLNVSCSFGCSDGVCDDEDVEPTANGNLSQFGITWFFDKPLTTDGVGDSYQYGTFANGDYWVVNPVGGDVVIVEIDPAFYRPGDTQSLMGDSTKIRTELGWKPEYTFEQLIAEMCHSDLEIAMEKIK